MSAAVIQREFKSGFRELSFTDLELVAGGFTGTPPKDPPPKVGPDGLTDMERQERDRRLDSCETLGAIAGGTLGLISGFATGAVATPVAGAAMGLAVGAMATTAATNACETSVNQDYPNLKPGF